MWLFAFYLNDLENLWKVAAENGKTFLMLVGDIGQDMNLTSYINTFYLGRI